MWHVSRLCCWPAVVDCNCSVMPPPPPAFAAAGGGGGGGGGGWRWKYFPATSAGQLPTKFEEPPCCCAWLPQGTRRRVTPAEEEPRLLAVQVLVALELRFTGRSVGVVVAEPPRWFAALCCGCCCCVPAADPPLPVAVVAAVVEGWWGLSRPSFDSATPGPFAGDRSCLPSNGRKNPVPGRLDTIFMHLGKR